MKIPFFSPSIETSVTPVPSTVLPPDNCILKDVSLYFLLFSCPLTSYCGAMFLSPTGTVTLHWLCYYQQCLERKPQSLSACGLTQCNKTCPQSVIQLYTSTTWMTAPELVILGSLCTEWWGKCGWWKESFRGTIHLDGCRSISGWSESHPQRSL